MSPGWWAQYLFILNPSYIYVIYYTLITLRTHIFICLLLCLETTKNTFLSKQFCTVDINCPVIAVLLCTKQMFQPNLGLCCCALAVEWYQLHRGIRCCALAVDGTSSTVVCAVVLLLFTVLAAPWPVPLCCCCWRYQLHRDICCCVLAVDGIPAPVCCCALAVPAAKWRVCCCALAVDGLQLPCVVCCCAPAVDGLRHWRKTITSRNSEHNLSRRHLEMQVNKVEKRFSGAEQVRVNSCCITALELLLWSCNIMQRWWPQ